MGNVSTTRRRSVSKELEKYCKPTGLYETCPWEERVVRRWIMDGQVAPRYPGADTPSYSSDSRGSGGGTLAGSSGGRGVSTYESTMMMSKSVLTSSAFVSVGGNGVGGGQQQQQQQHQQPQQTEECPICFMHYQGVNRTTCCAKPLCTECYLQVRPPRSSVVCPFCNGAKFSVEYLGPPTKEEQEKRMAEEQRTIEARIHAEQEELMRQVKERNARESSAAAAAAAAAAGGSPPPPAAGEGDAEGEGGGGVGVDGASSFQPSSSVGSSSSLISGPSYATVAERRVTEEQIRNQHAPRTTSSLGRSAASGGGGSVAVDQYMGGRRRHSTGRRTRHSSGRHVSTGDGDRDSSGDQRQNNPEEPGDQGEIQQVEDLMLMEALRLSVLEEQARRERSGDLRRAAAAASASASAGDTAQYQGATTGNDPAASLGATMSSPFWDRFEVPPGSSPATWASTPSGTGDDGPGAGAGPTTAHSSTAGEGGGRGATVREAAAAALAAAVATSRETASRFTPGMSSDPLFSFASAETAAAAAAASSVSSEGSAAAGSRGSGDLAGATTSTATVGDARTIAPTGSASANATGGAPSGGGVSAAEIEAVTEWRAREAGGAGRADITPPEETGVVAAVAEEGGRKFPANRAGDGRWFEVGLNSHVRDGQVETRQGIRGEGTSGARQALPGLEGSEAAAGETAGATVGGSGGGFPSELPDSEEDQLMLAIALSLKSNGSGSSSRNSMSAATAGAGVAGAMLPSTSASATAGPFSTTDATPPTEADDAGVYTSPARTSSCLGGAAMGLDAARSVMGEVSARKKEAGPEGDTRAPVPEDPFDIFFREKSGSREGRGTLEEESTINSKLPAPSDKAEVTGGGLPICRGEQSTTEEQKLEEHDAVRKMPAAQGNTSSGSLAGDEEALYLQRSGGVARHGAGTVDASSAASSYSPGSVPFDDFAAVTSGQVAEGAEREALSAVGERVAGSTTESPAVGRSLGSPVPWPPADVPPAGGDQDFTQRAEASRAVSPRAVSRGFDPVPIPDILNGRSIRETDPSSVLRLIEETALRDVGSIGRGNVQADVGSVDDVGGGVTLPAFSVGDGSQGIASVVGSQAGGDTGSEDSSNLIGERLLDLIGEESESSVMTASGSDGRDSSSMELLSPAPAGDVGGDGSVAAVVRDGVR